MLLIGLSVVSAEILSFEVDELTVAHVDGIRCFYGLLRFELFYRYPMYAKTFNDGQRLKSLDNHGPLEDWIAADIVHYTDQDRAFGLTSLSG